MQHALKYVEEGLACLERAGAGDGETSSSVAAAAGAPVVLMQELRNVLAAMTAVQQSWGLVEAGLEGICHDLFGRPELQPCIASGTLEDPGCQGLSSQAPEVVRAVGHLVGGLTDLHACTPALLRLARGHAALGARPEYFAALRQGLLDVLAEHLGPAHFTSEVGAAWAASFDIVTGCILSNYPGGGLRLVTP